MTKPIAAMAAEAAAREEPTEQERTAARALADLFGRPVLPQDVREAGHDWPYDYCEATIDGHRFRVTLHWGGGDARYSVSGFAVLVPFRKRWRTRTRWHQFWRLAQLDGVLTSRANKKETG